MTRLSVIVPATDRPRTLAACVAAIEAARPDEIVVVEEAPGSGPAAARNEGVTRASGDLLVFVDSDVLVHPGTFEAMREAFANDADLVALFGSYDATVATHGAVAAFRNLLHHTIHQRSQGPVTTFWAGIGAVRRSAFAAAGGFDSERYPHASIEDIELGGRLAAKGTIVLDGALQGTHLKEWTLGGMVATDLLRRGIPWVRLMAEQRSVPRTLNVGRRERVSTTAALAQHLCGRAATASPCGARDRGAARAESRSVSEPRERARSPRRGARGTAAHPAPAHRRGRNPLRACGAPARDSALERADLDPEKVVGDDTLLVVGLLGVDIPHVVV